MTVLLFEYGHTNIGSWDGKWSGSGKVYAKEVNLTKGLKEHLEALGIDCGKGKNHTFHYDFKDGWACNVTMTVGTKTEFKEIMKHSQGFLGYDWMIDSILKYGRILDPSLVNQSEPAGIVNNVQIIKSGFSTQNKEVEVDLQSVKWFLTTFRTNFIAKMTGLAQPNLSFYTKGEREIEAANYKTIVKLTKYSHIAKEGKEKIEWLLSDSGLTFHKISQEAGVARDTLYKIKDDFKRISYATFDKLVKYVDTHEKEKK